MRNIHVFSHIVKRLIQMQSSSTKHGYLVLSGYWCLSVCRRNSHFHGLIYPWSHSHTNKDEHDDLHDVLGQRCNDTSFVSRNNIHTYIHASGILHKQLSNYIDQLLHVNCLFSYFIKKMLFQIYTCVLSNLSTYWGQTKTDQSIKVLQHCQFNYINTASQ